MLGVSDDTLYERCSKEKGLIFSIYSAKKKAKGDGNLKITQYKEALAGDRGMLIWLGKQRLGQKDNHDMSVHSDMKIGICQLWITLRSLSLGKSKKSKLYQ